MIDLKFQFTPLPISTGREKNVKQMDQLEEEDYDDSLPLSNLLCDRLLDIK
jgi:hypothetical protein